jgi:S-formylglutathione hydrolase FrmB
MAHSANEFVPPGSAMKPQEALTAVGIESIVQVFSGGAHGKGFMDRALDNGLAFLRQALDWDQTDVARIRAAVRL